MGLRIYICPGLTITGSTHMLVKRKNSAKLDGQSAHSHDPTSLENLSVEVLSEHNNWTPKNQHIMQIQRTC